MRTSPTLSHRADLLHAHASDDLSYAVAETKSVLAEVRDLALAALTESERERHDRLHRRQDRDDFMAARWLARTLIGHRGGPAPDIAPPPWSQVCSYCDGQHGRPVISQCHPWGSHVSWSHSSGVVAAAVAHSVVGVDVQRTSNGGTGLSADAVPGIEQWLAFTRAEALVKAGMSTLDEALDNRIYGGPVTDTELTTWVQGVPPGWRLTDWTSQSSSAVASIVTGPSELLAASPRRSS